MAENKKFYWLKLQKDFFKRHDIRIIEEMPNGKDYVLFYLKLLLESIDHEGNLRFSDMIPYNEQMLSVITNTNIDIVKSAMTLFTELKMIDVLDDRTIYMIEVEKHIGSESGWAEKKRLQRAKKDNVPLLSSECPTELEYKSKNTEKECFTTTTTASAHAHTREGVENSSEVEPPHLAEVLMFFKSDFCTDRCSADPLDEALKFIAYNEKRKWDCLPDWEATAELWAARIKEHTRSVR